MAPIAPSELPRWVPGHLIASSNALGWRDVALRRYRYTGLDVQVPPLDHFTLVHYRRGATRMARRFEGRWNQADCAPGHVSLLTRLQTSHWRWAEDIEVVHVYLAEALVSRVAADMLDRDAAEVQLHDLLRLDDPRLGLLLDALAHEAQARAPGGAIAADALATQIAVHLLRHHARVQAPERAAPGRLSPVQLRRLQEHVALHLHDPLTLADLAAVAGLGVCTFARHFRATVGQAPHRWVMGRRVEQAEHWLAEGRLAVKEVAALCGFADQAHLTRVLRAMRGTTPARLRAG